MAKILEFHCREEQGDRASTPGHEGVTAEVIVFPGVRYERWEQPDRDSVEPGVDNECATANERDRLELAD